MAGCRQEIRQCEWVMSFISKAAGVQLARPRTSDFPPRSPFILRFRAKPSPNPLSHSPFTSPSIVPSPHLTHTPLTHPIHPQPSSTIPSSTSPPRRRLTFLQHRLYPPLISPPSSTSSTNVLFRAHIFNTVVPCSASQEKNTVTPNT